MIIYNSTNSKAVLWVLEGNPLAFREQARPGLQSTQPSLRPGGGDGSKGGTAPPPARVSSIESSRIDGGMPAAIRLSRDADEWQHICNEDEATVGQLRLYLMPFCVQPSLVIISRMDTSEGDMLARTARATSKPSFKVSRVFG